MDSMEYIRESWRDTLALTDDWLRTEGKEFMIEQAQRQYVDDRRYIVATDTQRVFWTCKMCGKKETIDYTAETLEQIWQGLPIQSVRLYREIDGKRISFEDDKRRNCCFKYGRDWSVKFLKTIILKESHRCDSRCEMATSEKCQCSCQGANHGIAYKSR